MTPENERLVRQSWKQFEPMAVASAAFFYEKLFELDPDARPLFARTDMEAQGRKVMHMFAEIVRSLDQPEKLLPKSPTWAGVTCTMACATTSTARSGRPFSGPWSGGWARRSRRR